MKEIKYIAYYDSIRNIDENRYYVLSATNKMDYIISVINKIGYRINIISASGTRSKRGYKGKTIELNSGNRLKLFRTFKWGNKIRKLISIFFMKLFLFLYIINYTKKNENIIVYHSLGYSSLIHYAKKIRKFKLILEVEEIYADVSGKEKDWKKECRIFKNADAFIFPTILLKEKINSNNRPFSLICGTYKVEKDRNCKFNDGKIHVVYAGTFDARKGGAEISIATSEFLDSNYHIHIIGFGTEYDKKILLEKIAEIRKTTQCTITFDGLKSGEEYIRFIQSCDIGLSTQNPNAKFNDTSFPSKVLSYMTNGLRVVSIRIKALQISPVNKLIYYYDINTAEAIAETIKSIDMNDNRDSKKMISELDYKFEQDLKTLLFNNEVIK